jgi:transposase InsO family protein
VAHARAKLTPLGRALLVDRVLVHGWPACRAAEAAGVSRATAHKWVRRFLDEGPSGLEDRSSAPHRRPNALGSRDVRRILAARRRTNWGPHRLGPYLGHPRSTVYGVLRREGVPRLRDLDRPTRTVIRYEKGRPGELVHIDVKKMGRIPPGGGHRMLGRSTGTRRMKLKGVGYDYLHVAVDDHSRVAYVEAHPDERGQTAAGFLTRAAGRFAELGISVESVMTDNAFAYIHSSAFRAVLEDIGATHTRIPPYHPQLNGKAERFNRTLKEEWAYTKLYRSNASRLAALERFVDFYNAERPHTALGGRPPMARLTT